MLNFNKDIIINTNLGKVMGNIINYKNKNLLLFKGIPYAHPPIYSLRWKPPILWKSNYSEEIYDATYYRDKPYDVRDMKRVMRTYINNIFNNFNLQIFTKYFNNKESEDCLYLNILTSTCERNKLPVLIYLTDTMFHYNNNDDKFLNKKIVDNDILIITINYRLGIFGFYYHDDLNKESKYNTSGNYGIMDVICAIKWIKQNIFCFGGDPENITLIGDGSGANIIIYLMSNKANEGLFQKVIINSFSFIYNIRKKSNINILIADELVGQGNNQILRMRNLSSKEINDKYKKYIVKNDKINYLSLFNPIIDYNIIMDEPYLIFKENMQINIPVLIGKNLCDGYFLYECGFKNILKNPNKDIYFNDKIDELKQIYKNIDKNNNISLQKYYDDFLFTMPLFLLMNLHKKNNKIYIYIYTYKRYKNNLKKSDKLLKSNLINGVYGCASNHFNKCNDYFKVNNNAHNILINHFCEFIKININLYSSLSLKDNSIWYEYNKNYIIYLGRYSCSKKFDISKYKLLEDRYLYQLNKYIKESEKNNINKYIKKIIKNIIKNI